MATKKTNKDEDMICTGQSPFNTPPMAYAMDVYQAYMQGMMHFWIAYSKLMTVPYYTQEASAKKPAAQKSTVNPDQVVSDAESEDSE